METYCSNAAEHDGLFAPNFNLREGDCLPTSPTKATTCQGLFQPELHHLGHPVDVVIALVFQYDGL
jgi:hypothetical protein